MDSAESFSPDQIPARPIMTVLNALRGDALRGLKA